MVWEVYRKRNGDQDQDIKVLVYPVDTPHEQLMLAAKLNSEHGWQLKVEDKESTAKAMYAYGTSYEDIAASLSVGKKKVADWLSRIVKDEKAKRDAKIFELWMACHTQEAIAEAVGVHKDTISEITDVSRKKFSETESDKSMMNHAADFDIPIYNARPKDQITLGTQFYSSVRWLHRPSLLRSTRT